MDINQIKLIAGIDVAYFNIGNVEYGVCVIDVVDYNTFELIERKRTISKINCEYEPGKLSERELPIIIQTYEKLESKPDLFMLDGNGYLHPNHNGIATTFSNHTNEVSIGVAKSFYNFANVNFLLDNEQYAVAPIIINNEVYGYALRSKLNTNPIFISPGGNINFEDSVDIVKHCMGEESRVPIPVRLADIDTRIERKKILKRG